MNWLKMVDQEYEDDALLIFRAWRYVKDPESKLPETAD